MGSDKQERAKGKSASNGSVRGRADIGCFVGISPDKAAKERITKRGLDGAWVEDVLSKALDSGLRFASRYDSKNDAYCFTCTRVGEKFADNQTIGAYHSSPVRSLMILLDALQTEFLAQEDWRYRQGKFDMEW